MDDNSQHFNVDSFRDCCDEYQQGKGRSSNRIYRERGNDCTERDDRFYDDVYGQCERDDLRAVALQN